ncbi:hypothetical protein AQJ43_28550 [Streptomyces avermitilis]|uniref:Uncharacterized protein n=1 Tax=Streptomyces avermitilis TaxID=33903 RepID=A0A499V674_STRAX|nr:hypothetical protein [Streptomyces avermitilis]KUN51195.1 hypothetical protein AQJ43_28550 [Streptomyces avermitilis]BBJ48330.1 hypothetical protein SAVMC3_09590 [Streptomyces avermitilis]GDY88208.1 hypothetical protein SAVCW2_74070 [Streptomyces avermitilis]
MSASRVAHHLMEHHVRLLIELGASDAAHLRGMVPGQKVLGTEVRASTQTSPIEDTVPGGEEDRLDDVDGARIVSRRGLLPRSTAYGACCPNVRCAGPAIASEACERAGVRSSTSIVALFAA